MKVIREVEKNQQLFKEEEKKREGEKISKQKTKTKNILNILSQKKPMFRHS